MAELATRQGGAVSLEQLRALGMSTRATHRRVATGRLHRVHLGVFAVGHLALTPDGRRWADVLACGPRAVLSHRSAAVLWGLIGDERGRDVIVRGRPGGRATPRGVRLHRPRRLDDDEIAEIRGLAVTTVPRTLVDLAAVLRPDRLGRAVHEAEFLGLLDVAVVLEAIERAPGRRGTRRLRAALATPSPGRTRSTLERRFVTVCRRALLPAPRLNVHVDVGDRLVEVDALWPEARVVAELDGAAAHRTRRAFEEDRRRDAELTAAGYLVVRFTWRRVKDEPDAVAAQLRRILNFRGGPG